MKKLQYDINREAAEVSALSCGKIDKNKYLTGDEILPFNKRQIIQQANFPYCPLEKAFQKQIEKQIDAINSLDISNKKDKVKHFETIFPLNLMNDLICANLKELVKLQDIVKKDNLNYKSKRREAYNFGKYSLPIVLK